MSKVVKAIGSAVTSVVKGVVKAVTSVVKAVVNVVSTVVSFVTQPFMGMLGGMPDVPSAQAEADRQQGVLVQTQGSNINIPVVYGYRKVGGTVVFAETGSTNNRYLYVAYVFSEGVVEGLREVFIDDYQLPGTFTANLNAGQVVDITTDRYKDRVRLQWYPGVYFSNPQSSPVGAAIKSGVFAEAPSFKSSMNFNGLAVLFARYEWKEIKTQADADANPFSGNIPQVQVSMLGRRVASLLVDAELTAYDTAPVRYSTNPAEILLDYLRNPRYGKGLTNSDIHWDTWKKAARKCNTTVTYLNTTGDITGPIMTCNFVLDTGQTLMSNVKTLLMGFRAYMPYVQGKYKLKIEDAGNETDITSGQAVIQMTAVASPYLKSTYEGNVCDIVGDVTYTGIERSAKYNVVAVSYVDPDQKFSVQQVIYPETEEERQEYITKDGGRENKLEATFPTLTNYAMAKDMARLLFNKSRRQETVSLTISSEGLELEPGDSIRIQSNILNFGTIPWRIVSLKINDNMTVDLALVKNPDDIYPYTRVGEEDIVLAVYVPKGSIIYYPSSDNQPLIGLVPPTRAIYPSDFAPNPGNPGSTDPNAPGGGGVGGGNPPGGDTGGSPGTDVNNPPVTPPPPPPFEAQLTLKRSSLTSMGSGNYMVNLVFTQPADALYSYSIFWWRVNRFSPWIELKKEERPGAGGEISISFGPLPGGEYDWYARSFATDGRASTRISNGRVAYSQATAELNPNLQNISSFSTIQATEGWRLPDSQIPSTPRYDDDIAVFNITTKLNSGQPYDPRQLTCTLQQVNQTLTDALNPLIDGVRIYYRALGDEYWDYEDHKFSKYGQYFPGAPVTFTLTGTFGARAYPTVPQTGNNLTQQTYEFVARLLYSDGTPAQKQLGPQRGLVEWFSVGVPSAYQFTVFGTDSYASFGPQRSQFIPTGFGETFKTVDQDPNKGADAALSLFPLIDKIQDAKSTPRLTFRFWAPTTFVSKFRGYRIRIREVVPGTNPDFKTFDVGPAVSDIVTQVTYTLQDSYFRFNQRYEWIITVLVSTSSGIVDGTQCLYGKASIPSNNLDEDNIYERFNFSGAVTADVLAQFKTTFPAIPVANAKTWIKRYDQFQATASTSVAPNFVRSSTGFPVNIYMKLKFQALSATASHVIVYRRVFSPSGIQRTTVTSVAKYWELGPWEKVRVALAGLSADAEGFKTINLRGPIDHTYFNGSYQVAGAPNNGVLVNPRYGGAGLWPGYGSANDLAGMYPYYQDGVGNTGKDLRSTRWAEYLVVIEDSVSGESAKGLLLRSFFSNEYGNLSVYQRETDGFISQYGNVPRDEIIDNINTTYNSLSAGFGRNLNEAITGQALNKITIGDIVPARPVGAFTGAYSRFIENAVNGDVIY